MFVLILLGLLGLDSPPLSHNGKIMFGKAKVELRAGGGWREHPLRQTQVARGLYGFRYCDDPDCPLCSGEVYNRDREDVPIKR